MILDPPSEMVKHDLFNVLPKWNKFSFELSLCPGKKDLESANQWKGSKGVHESPGARGEDIWAPGEAKGPVGREPRGDA